jgi:chromosome partitioning protein
MAIKLAFANLKGGVGKTISSVFVANLLRDRGERVLLIDCDPQCNSTATYSANPNGVATMADIILAKTDASEVVQRTEMGDIIPNDEALREIDGKISPFPGMYKLIDRSLKNIEDDYDFIIYDTPPYQGLLLGNVLNTVDYVIVPVECELYVVQGMYQFAKVIEQYQEENEKLKVLGVLRIKYKKNHRITKIMDEEMPAFAEKLNTKVFETKIRESVKAKESVYMRQSIASYAPDSTIVEDYNNMIDEMFERLNYTPRQQRETLEMAM